MFDWLLLLTARLLQVLLDWSCFSAKTLPCLCPYSCDLSQTIVFVNIILNYVLPCCTLAHPGSVMRVPSWMPGCTASRLLPCC